MLISHTASMKIYLGRDKSTQWKYRRFLCGVTGARQNCQRRRARALPLATDSFASTLLTASRVSQAVHDRIQREMDETFRKNVRRTQAKWVSGEGSGHHEDLDFRTELVSTVPINYPVCESLFKVVQSKMAGANRSNGPGFHHARRLRSHSAGSMVMWRPQCPPVGTRSSPGSAKSTGFGQRERLGYNGAQGLQWPKKP